MNLPVRGEKQNLPSQKLPVTFAWRPFALSIATHSAGNVNAV